MSQTASSPDPPPPPKPRLPRTVGDVLGPRGAAPIASILRGALGGAALGFGFHALRALTGSLTPSVAAREGLHSAIRLSSMLAGYSACRSLLREFTGSDALACMGAGSTTVCAATFGSAARVAAQRAHLAKVLRATAPIPTHLVFLSCASSGAIVVGGADLCVSRVTGTRW